jgi:hypothetical protein
MQGSAGVRHRCAVHEHHAIVPNSDGTAILVVEGRLPVVRTDKRGQIATVEALGEVYDVRVPFLRVVRRLEDNEERLTTLFEVDIAPPNWTPPQPASWVALDSLRAADVEPLFSGGLDAPHRPLDQLRKAAPELAQLGDRLAAHAIPETVVHGDLHQWNAILQDGRVVVFDWSDIALGHPFLDLAPVLLHAEAGEGERGRLIGAYLEPWAGIAPEAQLREAAALGEALGCVHQAVSYRAIRAAFEPADRWLFAGANDFWLKRGAELAERL